MRCKAPLRIYPPGGDPAGLLVPCGKCLLCRISRRQEWALRMVHELTYHEKASFLTLTYNDDNLPEGGTLCKRDVQLWLKLIRKYIHPRKLRYYLAGEYGTMNGRPHYHAIMFGLGLNEEDKMAVIRTWNKCDWENDHIRRHAFGVVNDDTIRYTAQYIDQKLYGDAAVDRYDRYKLERPFNLTSKGIGRSWADEHAARLKTGDAITFRGRPATIPRYYVKRLELELTPDQTKEVEAVTGLSYDEIEYSRMVSPHAYWKVRRQISATRGQRHKNAESRGKLRPRECD